MTHSNGRRRGRFIYPGYSFRGWMVSAFAGSLAALPVFFHPLERDPYSLVSLMVAGVLGLCIGQAVSVDFEDSFDESEIRQGRAARRRRSCIQWSTVMALAVCTAVLTYIHLAFSVQAPN